jgi:hypothetical protein
VASSRIHILGEIGVGFVRAQAETLSPEVGRTTDALWEKQVQRFASDVVEAPWYPLSFETLASHTESPDAESAELRFASRLAEFLRSLPLGIGLERSTFSLLDVYSYAPDELLPDVAAESLRVFEEAAEVLPETSEGRAMLGSSRLPKALGDLRLDPTLHERVAQTALTLDRAAMARGIEAEPLRVTLSLGRRGAPARAETFVNIGVDEVGAPGAGPSLPRVLPGAEVLVWVELGPRNPDAAAGDAEPVEAAALVDGQELDVVVFPDAELAVGQDAGRVRIVSSGAFPVVRRALEAIGGDDDDLLDTRLYFRVVLPDQCGLSRLRAAVYLKGVLVHVEQLTLPIGIDRPPSTRTMHRLTRTFDAEDSFSSLRAPTLSIYSNAGDGTHDFSFYLPGHTEKEPGIPKQLHLDSNEVISAINSAREVLRTISWGDGGELDGQHSRFPIDGEGLFGDAPRVSQALIDLAVMGHGLWGYLSAELDRSPEFRSRLQVAMKPPGTVQLSTKDHPSQILPLQVLYDRNLNTASPSYLKLCSATDAWLSNPGADDPPCLAQLCPDEGSAGHVCLAGFWGIRHGVSINPAHRAGELRSTVESAPKPVGTLATTTDPAIVGYWDEHEPELMQILNVISPRSVTAAPIFRSLADDRSVVLYVLAHVDCRPQHPRIWMSEGPDGAIDWSTLNVLHPHLEEHLPVVFINACASAAMTPARLLSLIDEFFLYGAGGAVGTEISVFVDFAAAFADEALGRYAGGETLSQSLRRARIEGLRRMNPMGFAYIGFGLHDLRLVGVE